MINTTLSGCFLNSLNIKVPHDIIQYKVWNVKSV